MEGENNDFNVVLGACVRNYAAEEGRYVLDGCCQFAVDALGSRYCEACGCDRNYHIVIPPYPGAGKLNIPVQRGGGNAGGGTQVTADNDHAEEEVINTTPENAGEKPAASGSKKKPNKRRKKK